MLDEFSKQHPQAQLVCMSGHEYWSEEEFDLVFSNGAFNISPTRCSWNN
jgi:hypothetical protein